MMEPSLGAYYTEAPLRAVSGLGADPVVLNLQPASDTSPVPAAPALVKAAVGTGTGFAIGGVMLAVALGLPLVLGGLGYWYGGKIAPSPSQKKTYQWGSAAANIVFPILGPAALALVAAANSSETR